MTQVPTTLQEVGPKYGNASSQRIINLIHHATFTVQSSRDGVLEQIWLIQKTFLLWCDMAIFLDQVDLGLCTSVYFVWSPFA